MKNFILCLSVLIFGMSNAQLPVWINSFDTPEDLQGWRTFDINNNGNGWMQGQNIYHNGTSLTYGTSGVLRYSINLVPTGNATGFAAENDWIISPEIDLTNASGTITLAGYLGRQRSTHASVSRDVYIFVSTPGKMVPELVDFQQLATEAQDAGGAQYRFSAGSNLPTDLTQYAESLIDISAFAGKKIYLGLWSNRISSGGAFNVQNINIDEMAIYASVLSTQDSETSKSLTKIKQNPVAGSLQLQLNPAMKEANTMVIVYNNAGQKVITTKYVKEINTSKLSIGTYITIVSDGIVTEKVKFIKK